VHVVRGCARTHVRGTIAGEIYRCVVVDGERRLAEQLRTNCPSARKKLSRGLVSIFAPIRRRRLDARLPIPEVIRRRRQLSAGDRGIRGLNIEIRRVEMQEVSFTQSQQQFPPEEPQRRGRDFPFPREVTPRANDLMSHRARFLRLR